jgi:hypothetical protein
MGWTGYVAFIGEMRNAYKILLNLKGNTATDGDLDVDGGGYY